MSPKACFFLFLIVASLLQGCNNQNETDSIEPLDFEYGYFPLSIGNYWEYEVDSTIYDITSQGNVRINTSAFWKEVVADTFQDNLGRLSFRIERFYRKSDTLEWTLQTILSASLLENRLEWQEGNLRFVSLLFPPEEGISWNANQFIPVDYITNIAGEPIELFKNWGPSLISEKNIPFLLNNFNFDSTLNIVQADSENLIELRRAESRYAKGVGLIERIWWVLDTQAIDNPLPWEEKAEKGFILEQRLVNYFVQ